MFSLGDFDEFYKNKYANSFTLGGSISLDLKNKEELSWKIGRIRHYMKSD